MGHQSKAVAFLDDSYGAVAMMNINPDKEQTESVIGVALRDALSRK